MIAAKVGKLGAHPTSAELIKGLDSLSNDTLGGADVPLTYTNGNRTVSCGFTISSKNGHFIATNGGRPVCAGK